MNSISNNSSYYFKDNILYPRFPEFNDNPVVKNFTLVSNFSKTGSALNKLIITNPDRPKSVGKTLELSAKDGHGFHGGGHHGHGGGHYEHSDHHEDHKGHGYGHGGGKGCVGGHKTKKHGGGFTKSKYMMPAMVGLMTAKAIILPLMLKSLALMSAKGLFLGMLATIMATILSLKKLVEPAHKYESKKDDTKIEIIPVPIHEKYHHYSKKDYKDYEFENDSKNHPYNGYY